MGKPAIDLIGQEFNCWKVIERDYEYPRIHNLSLKTSYWKCICTKCNKTIKTMRKDTLKKYKRQSCGCESEKLDLTSQTFGRLTVLEEDFDYVKINNISNKYKRYWKCQCSCANKTVKSISQDHLTSTTNPTLSCGCLSVEKLVERSQKDISGKVFGRLTAIKPTEKRANNHIIWKCKCSCGNPKIIEVPIDRLTGGITQSCGCLNREKTSERFTVDEINNIYGKLTVIKRDPESYPDGWVHWLCKCSCGNSNLVSIAGVDLRNGKKNCCPLCTPRSKGEEEIRDLLLKNNISFIQEQSFDDCYFPDTKRKARFDFYINNQYLIEFDGRQHIEETTGDKSNWWSLEYVQSHDKIKNDYCKQKGIPLIRIPYSKKGHIILEDLLLDTSKYKII